MANQLWAALMRAFKSRRPSRKERGEWVESREKLVQERSARRSRARRARLGNPEPPEFHIESEPVEPVPPPKPFIVGVDPPPDLPEHPIDRLEEGLAPPESPAEPAGESPVPEWTQETSGGQNVRPGVPGPLPGVTRESREGSFGVVPGFPVHRDESGAIVPGAGDSGQGQREEVSEPFGGPSADRMRLRPTQEPENLDETPGRGVQGEGDNQTSEKLDKIVAQLGEMHSLMENQERAIESLANTVEGIESSVQNILRAAPQWGTVGP